MCDSLSYVFLDISNIKEKLFILCNLFIDGMKTYIPVANHMLVKIRTVEDNIQVSYLWLQMYMNILAPVSKYFISVRKTLQTK